MEKQGLVRLRLEFRRAVRAYSRVDAHFVQERRDQLRLELDGTNWFLDEAFSRFLGWGLHVQFAPGEEEVALLGLGAEQGFRGAFRPVDLVQLVDRTPVGCSRECRLLYPSVLNCGRLLPRDFF